MSEPSGPAARYAHAIAGGAAPDRVQTVDRPVRQPGIGVGSVMGSSSEGWHGEVVRTWLDRRAEAAKLDQAAADRRGYEAQDDYDKAAAQEWVCRVLQTGGHADDRAAFAARIKELLAQDEYRIASIHDDRRFDRYVRANLRKVATMTRANEGFANTLRYQS